MEVKTHCSREDLIQNLRDADCSEEVIQVFLKGLDEGKLPESLRMLAKHRGALLDVVHAEEKKIDCLDYLVYMLKKENAVH